MRSHRKITFAVMLGHPGRKALIGPTKTGTKALAMKLSVVPS